MTCKWKVFCKQGDTCVAHEGYDVWKCTAFKDKEEPLTNEEWFCSLPTEEKATFLAIQIRLGVEFYRTNDERYQNHAWWVKWLKEKHE